MKNNDSFTSFLAAVIVIGGILLFASIFMGEEECSKAGCTNDRASDSSYCYLHKSGRYSWSSSGGSSSKYSSSGSSSASKSSSSSSTSSSTKKSTSGSSTKSSSSSSWKSYDEGYDAVYEDDDYDWDRYWSDSDYADGVDDAMEDLDW